MKVIIDTDPGQDDAFAILLALAAPDVEVLGIIAASGNLPVEVTSNNCRRIVELAGQPEIPVYKGCIRPIVRDPRPVPEIHGETGIDGYDFPPAKKEPEAGHGVDFIIKTVMSHEPGKITILSIAPQTNVAMALRREPKLIKRLKRIVFMGGGYFQGGNMTPAAEYNILVDPEAARIVLQSGVPVTATPLDCTHTAPAPIGWSKELEALGTKCGDACAGMMKFFEVYGNAKHKTKSRPLHDAVAMAWILWPELFEGKLCPVDVECAGELTTGMTVVDWLRQTKKKDNCLWLNGCTDKVELYDRMRTTLSLLP